MNNSAVINKKHGMEFNNINCKILQNIRLCQEVVCVCQVKSCRFTIEPLSDHSHRPRSHPYRHQVDELKVIRDMRRRNLCQDDILDFS